MSQPHQKSQSVSAERRHTSIFTHPFEKPPSVSHLPIFNLTINKENLYPQKQSWDQYLQTLQQTTASQKKRPEQYVELSSQNDSKVKFKFPLYTDNQIGITSEYQKLLQEAYENDDDINTRESVLEFFVQVCKTDIMQGIRENQQILDKNGNPIVNFAGLQNRIQERQDEQEQTNN